MFNKLKDLFGKKPEPVIKEKSEPKTGKNSKEPWVSVVDTKFDEGTPNQGFMELDWNKPFVEFLKQNGYEGATDEEIVEKWFTELCKNIGGQLEEESKFVADADKLPKRRKKS